MKIAPVSGDLLVKLAVTAVAVGAVIYAIKQASGAANAYGQNVANSIVDAARAAADSINPVNPNNVFASTANDAVSAAAGRPETLGGWIYSATHPDPTTYVPPSPLDTATTFGSVGGFYSQPSALY